MINPNSNATMQKNKLGANLDSSSAACQDHVQGMMEYKEAGRLDLVSERYTKHAVQISDGPYPSRGVSPMDVSRVLPFSTAVIDAPAPTIKQWQASDQSRFKCLLAPTIAKT